MASLFISYFATVDKYCAGDPIRTDVLTTSGTSAAISGTVPEGAVVLKAESDAAHYVTINVGTPTAAATNGAYQAAGQPLWLRTRSSNRAALKVAAVTV